MKILITFLLVSLISTKLTAGPVLEKIDHLGLSVLNLEASENFFVKYGGFKVVKRDAKYPSAFLKNDSIAITLWQVKDPDNAIRFNRKNNVGLHHVAFSVSSFKALDELYGELKNDKAVKIDFSPELLNKGPAKHMMVFEPSGNRIEFIYRPKVK